MLLASSKVHMSENLARSCSHHRVKMLARNSDAFLQILEGIDIDKILYEEERREEETLKEGIFMLRETAPRLRKRWQAK